MIISMTGFARSEAAVPTGSLGCELRSVNHRFLEASLRLPEELRPLEAELRTRMQKELRRGKVDCIFTYRASTEASRALDIDTTVVNKLHAALGQLAASATAANVPAQLNLVDLLRFPGVLRETSIDTDALQVAARTLFGKALTDLIAMRSSEGARLRELIAQRCDQLQSLVSEVRHRLPELQLALRARFADRLAELGTSVDEGRLEQEVALLLARGDVAEELDRLIGHITETRKIMSSPEAAGRRLDFLMQEFNREANTLSSKSQDLATTRIAVEMKVLIEQMREQVQNIE
jgi:uncharacterized protein (TIGR00255 family)